MSHAFIDTPTQGLAGLNARADLPALAAAVVAHAAQAWAGCEPVLIAWLEGERAAPAMHPAGATLGPALEALVTRALATAEPVQGPLADGRPCAVRLTAAGADPDGDSAGAVLVLRRAPAPGELPALGQWAVGLHERMAHALEREHLRRQVLRLQQAERLQRALFAIADVSASDLDMHGMLRRLHEIVGGLMYADNFFIALYDPARDALQFPYFVDTADRPWQDPHTERSLDSIRDGKTWHLLRGGRPLRGSYEQIAAQVEGPLVVFDPAPYDWLGVPMLDGGDVRGALVVQSYDPQRPRYTATDQSVLAFVADHILTALVRKQAQAELERRVEQRTRQLTAEIAERQRNERLQATLFQLAEQSHSAPGVGAFLQDVQRLIGEHLDSRNLSIAIESTPGALTYDYFVDERLARPRTDSLVTRLTRHVLSSGRALLAELDADSTTPEVLALRDRGVLADEDAGGAWLGVPLTCSDRTVGVLALRRYDAGGAWSARDRDLLTFIGYQVANGIERQRIATGLKAAHAELEQRVEERTRELREQVRVREETEQQLRHQVYHDPLTHLPNRQYLREHLARALARYQRDPSRRFAVLLLDLDRFKLINETAGEAAGDTVLQAVAQRFATCLRTPDLLVRLGADEFVVVMDNVQNDEAPARLAQRLIHTLNDPVQVGERRFLLGTSVGISLSDPHYREPDELLRDANIALRRAKAGERPGFELFDERLHRHALEQLQMESDLRRAIVLGEFEPWFQPVVRLADGSITGYEALVRWRHPERGVLPPGVFLSVAANSGLLEQIDWQMYRKTCEVIPRLLEPGQYVNLNVSPRHFRTGEIDQRLLALLKEHAVEPSQVRIEITEDVLMDDPELMSAVLQRLHAAGIHAALDDFGTGYSSLSYLHRFPLHTVKLDRSFITPLEPGVESPSGAVAGAILGLSRSLGLEVVAEGIETEPQRAALQALGCELGQGYLFARPQPLDAILATRQAQAIADADGA